MDEHILVVNCFFSCNVTRIHPAPKIGHCVFFSNNKKLEHEAIIKGWNFVFVDVPQVNNLLTSSIQSKYIKFLKFIEDFKEYEQYKTVVYFDHKFTLNSKQINKLVEISDKPILIRTTPRNKTTIWQEVNEANPHLRYKKNMDKTLEFIKREMQNGATDKVRICNTGLIVYKDVEVIKNMLDKIYQEIIEQQQPECQIIWAIVSQKYDDFIKKIPFNYFS